MNLEQQLTAMRDVIQRDVGNRGLARDPNDNLINACAADFAAACRSIAETARPVLAVVTGFPIAAAQPPCDETDGPLGAVFLARALAPLGIEVSLLADGSAVRAMECGLAASRLVQRVPVRMLPDAFVDADEFRALSFPAEFPHPTHLIAIERVGPGYTIVSLRRDARTSEHDLAEFTRTVPETEQGRPRSMRGRDLSALTRPAQLLFEDRRPGVTTIGIGDGGNEIGMGKIAWRTISRNIPNGGLIACRVPTDHLIVAGVSNWGGYALAAGVARLRNAPLPADLFDVECEREILRVMVEAGPLVDGVTAKPTVSVDGLSFEDHARPLVEIGRLTRGEQ
jgi:hypothetical protein